MLVWKKSKTRMRLKENPYPVVMEHRGRYRRRRVRGSGLGSPPVARTSGGREIWPSTGTPPPRSKNPKADAAAQSSATSLSSALDGL